MNINQFASVALTNGINANIEIIRSERAKRISLRANRHGIYAIVPTLTAHTEILTFIESRKGWISKSVTYFEKITKGLDPSLIQQDKVLFMGTPYELQTVKDRLSYVIISESLGRITVHSPNERSRKKTILDFYRQHTSRILDDRIGVLQLKTKLRKLQSHINKVSEIQMGKLFLKKEFKF